MGTIKNLLEGLFMGVIIGSIALAFMTSVKWGYDHFDAFHSMIDTIGHLMLTNPFA